MMKPDNQQDKQQTAVESASVTSDSQKTSQRKNWYQDRYESLRVQRNFLFLFAVIGVVGLGFAVNMVAKLNDSKVFEPFVIEVEDRTSIVSQVSQKTVETYTADEAVVKYFISKYVRARESYHPSTYKYFYDTEVRVLSDENVYRQFVSSVVPSAPNSPLLLKTSRMRTTDVKSISFLENKEDRNAEKSKKGTVQVRIVTRDVRLDGLNPINELHYIIIITYEFREKLELTQPQRYINPLGFQTTSYRKDVELDTGK